MGLSGQPRVIVFHEKEGNMRMLSGAVSTAAR